MRKEGEGTLQRLEDPRLGVHFVTCTRRGREG